MNAEVTQRIRHRAVRSRLLGAEEAAALVQDGMTIGVSGFARAGGPKEVPLALARRARDGRPRNLTVWSGGSLGHEVDGELAATGALRLRLPYQSLPEIRQAINAGEIGYVDQHLSACAEMVRAGYLGPLHLVLIEICAVTEEGWLVPTSSVGNSALYVEKAERVVAELNLWQPAELEGMHDIWAYSPPPRRLPLPLVDPLQRIGTAAIPLDPGKLVGVVVTDRPDHPYAFEEPDPDSRLVGEHLLDFLRHEVAAGRLPGNLLPLQVGVGNVGNAVLLGLAGWHHPGLTIYSEVLQDGVLDLIDSGVLRGASGTALALSDNGQRRLHRNLGEYRRYLVLRPQEISNGSEAIRRLGVVAVNTAVEVDIYGNVNSSHLRGTHIMNGIGGSGDFARNALLSIFVTPSTARGASISRVVPMVTHVDHTEHEVSVVITEQGVADLRGLSPRQRAPLIIARCAHPAYRPALEDYFQRALRRGGHTPHLLEEALSPFPVHREAK